MTLIKLYLQIFNVFCIIVLVGLSFIIVFAIFVLYGLIKIFFAKIYPCTFLKTNN